MQLPIRAVAGSLIVGVAACLVPACGGGATAALTRLLEARRLASEMHVEFIQASEASNRAVMATSEDTSASAVAESKRARDVVNRNIAALKPLLESLGYRDDLRYLEGFTTRFEESKRLDDEIVSLAVEGYERQSAAVVIWAFAASGRRVPEGAGGTRFTCDEQQGSRRCTRRHSSRGGARDSSATGSAHRRTRRRGDDAHGRAHGGGGSRGSQRPERIAVCFAP